MLAFLGRTWRCGIVSCCKGCIGAAGMGVVAMIGCHGAFPRVVFPFDVNLAPRRAGSLLVVYASEKNQEPEPRRITSNVKRNLHQLKIFKEFAKKQTSLPRPTMSYRKKKIDKQDMLDSADDYKDSTTKLYQYVSFQKFDGWSSSGFCIVGCSPLLLCAATLSPKGPRGPNQLIFLSSVE